MSAWNPDQYNRFAAERERPFWDLAGLLEPVPSPRLVDLGCGDGRLTAELDARIGARETVGIDSSEAMLARAQERARPALRFERGDIGGWTADGEEVVFANAALQWVEDHPRVLARWRAGMPAGGQLAVQVPTNADHPSHVVARELAEEWLGAAAPADPVERNVLAPEAYAELLEELGFERQHVRLQVYGHRLAASADVVEWVKGTSLTRLRAPLVDEATFERFLEEYRRRLLAAIGERTPYFYAFKRILMWGRLP